MIAKEKSRAGFTLVEMLAALAIVSMIILSTGTLVHQGAFFFDRGTRAIDVNEQLALAIDCLTRDFGAVRFVQQTTTNGTTVAFSGEPTSADDDAKVVFVTAGGRAAGPLGEEVVSVSVETNDDASAQLVRRRSAWRGPRMRLEDAQPGEAVILLKGRFTASFSFSKIAQDGNIVWYDSWTKEQGLPHSVRLNMHDETTGADLAGAIFPVHADAPAACTKGKLDCLKGSDPGAAPKKP